MISVNLLVLACRQFTLTKAFSVTVNGLLVKGPLCVRLIRVPVAGEVGVSTKGGRVGIGGMGLEGRTSVLVAGAEQAARKRTNTRAIFVFMDNTS
jgi:hypothetical protein